MVEAERTTFGNFLATVISDDEFESVLGDRSIPRDPAVSDRVYEYQEREIAHARAVYESQRRRDTVDIASFFDDVRMQAPISDRLPGVPVWQLLPFFNHVIVWLEPFRSPEGFERTYGMSPESFVAECGTRQSPGRIVPIFNAPPTAFVGLPHFEPILRLEPPTHFRDLFFQRALAGPEAFRTYRDEARALMLGEFGDRARFASLREVDRGSVRDLLVTAYAQVCAFGGAPLVRGVVAQAASGEHLADLLFFYALVLYDSHVSPLGGTYPCEREQMSQLTAGLIAPTSGSMSELPMEFGRALTRELALPVPAPDSGVPGFWSRELREEWAPVRDELAELEGVLGAAAASPRSERLSEVWNDVTRTLSSARSARPTLQWASAGVGMMGKDPHERTGLPGLLESAAGVRLGSSLFEVESVYRRVARPRHLACVLDLEAPAESPKKDRRT